MHPSNEPAWLLPLNFATHERQALPYGTDPSVGLNPWVGAVSLPRQRTTTVTAIV
jgi:hypothetical protein